MMFPYARDGQRLVRLSGQDDLATALWIDLYRPQPHQVQAVRALGTEVPSLEEMEEIEISSRLYHENDMDYLTVVLPGLSETKSPISGPVCFILSAKRLITVRHHAPRPFETYPDRADKVGPGCNGPAPIFLSLSEEIVGRLADILEGVGTSLDRMTAHVFAAGAKATDTDLQDSLRAVARESDLLGRVRLSLLTLERAVSYFGQSVGITEAGIDLKPSAKGLMRDIQALEVHADYLHSRLAMASDVTLGMVNLAQNQTVKIVSVVAVVFLPPTVIASAYGMNFKTMPELDWQLGYPMAIAMMIASAACTYLFFKWRRWL